ncbi:MAG TPA: hypothetical protein VFE14_09365 [Micromonosporaceae bacterium]|nr:hypothetical protein [Micromonosporaceae bacterium]
MTLRTPSRRLRRTATIAVLAAGSVLGAATPAVAYANSVHVNLRMLVVTDGRPNVSAITAQLDREGVPYDLVDMSRADRPVLTTAFLEGSSGGVPVARYQAVVLPHESALPPDELAALAAYEQQYGIRQADAYTWANPGVGLNFAAWTGTVDGMTATVAPAGITAGFGYLNGPIPLDDVDPAVAESFGYLATPASAAFTPLVTAPVPDHPGTAGSLLGAYAHDGREELVVTVSMNQNQTHTKVLAHGIVEWLTRGVHLGFWRNWFSLHIDDVFLPDDRWHTGANCTVGDNCNPQRDPSIEPYATPIRMVPADVDALLAWQRANGLKLDMTFNAEGSVDAGGADPLSAKLLANRAELRWLNHTYGHAYLGCVQDFGTVPWHCATDPTTGAIRWVSRADIRAQISQNTQWASAHSISLDPRELVTGEHSGLRTLPQMPVDNPNLGPALSDTGVRFIAADNSRDPAPRAVGPALTVPRYPMNIYYNVGTVAEEVDEYNWIYTSTADGGGGICEANPATSTCIAPLTPADFAGYLVPLEARIALGHVVSDDPRPHYAHQSNITEDRVLYPVLDAMLAGYRSRYAANTPLLNPRMAEISAQLRRADAWRAAVAAKRVDAYLRDGRITVVNKGGGAVEVPITAPAGTRVVTLSLLGIELLGKEYGEAYGGSRSGWSTLAFTGTQLLLRAAG